MTSRGGSVCAGEVRSPESDRGVIFSECLVLLDRSDPGVASPKPGLSRSRLLRLDGNTSVLPSTGYESCGTKNLWASAESDGRKC